MTPAEFMTIAQEISGKHWRTRIGEKIDRDRYTVWEYATGKREIPEIVAKLMLALRPKRKAKKA